MGYLQKAASNPGIRTGIGGMAGGGIGAAAGYATSRGRGGSSNAATNWDRWTGRAGEREDRKNYDQSTRDQYGATQGILGGMKGADDAYYSKVDQASEAYRQDRDNTYQGYKNDLDELNNEARAGATDARKTYTNDIQPKMKSIMEDAQTQAGQAMSLADAGDVNNSVHRGVRDMYEQQAQGVGRQGLADSGVLAALGAQATAGQLGGAPITGSQLATLQGQNMAQSGQAYSRAQQQMQSLREQGINKGFEESNAQYERGERARDRASNSVKDYQTADEIYQDRQGRYRDERGRNRREGYDTRNARDRDELSVQTGRAGLQHDLSMGQGDRELAAQGQMYGQQQAGLAAGAAQKAAFQNTLMQGAFGVGGAVAGGIAGRPAAVGAAAQQGAQYGGPQQQAGGGYRDYGNTQPGYGYYNNGNEQGPPRPYGR